MPPVSMRSKRRPFHSHAISLRSRVMPGALVDDRRARARQAVDERGLADVGVADDRDLHGVLAPTSADDARHDLVDAQAGGVDLDGIGRRDHRRVLAARVALVALADLVDGHAAAPGALVLVGRQPHLELGVGRHDRADVAPLGDPVAAAMSARCWSSRAARTAGSAARREASWEISGVRIASLTSSPSSSTRSPSKRMSRPPGSLAPDSATAR